MDLLGIITVIVSVVLAVACSVVAAGCMYFGLRQNALRMGVRLTDLEDRYMSLKGRKMVEAKKKQDDWIDEALATAKPTQPVRYDNDPR